MQAVGRKIDITLDYLRAKFVLSYNQYVSDDGAGVRNHELFKNLARSEFSARARIAKATANIGAS
jgi:hypothetical protein